MIQAACLDTEKEQVRSFELKGGLYPLTVLQLFSGDLALFSKQLLHKISQAPKFFAHAPVVLDLQGISKTQQEIKFDELLQILRQHQLIPVGMKGGDLGQQAAAAAAGLATLQDSIRPTQQAMSAQDKPASAAAPDRLDTARSAERVHSTAQPHAGSVDNRQAGESALSKIEALGNTHSRVITEPVRSGQQIYVRGGDLIVLAPVSHGAELLADGHIHVYGPLRGRALAGVTGDQNAHIFCQSLEAELISIAGQYKISEDMASEAWQAAVDISIQAGTLAIKLL